MHWKAHGAAVWLEWLVELSTKDQRLSRGDVTSIAAAVILKLTRALYRITAVIATKTLIKPDLHLPATHSAMLRLAAKRGGKEAVFIIFEHDQWFEASRT